MAEVISLAGGVDSDYRVKFDWLPFHIASCSRCCDVHCPWRLPLVKYRNARDLERFLASDPQRFGVLSSWELQW